MSLPLKFDGNEWFIITGLLVSLTIIFLLPKKFPYTITILFMAFSMVIPIILDTMISTKPFDFYKINDSPKFEIFDLLLWFFYAPFGYFFIYIFERWNLHGFSLFIYIIVSSMISIGFEYLTIKAHLFTYNGWLLSYSFPVYLIVQSTYIAFFLWIRNLFLLTKPSDLN
ncbi:hypothetical protein ACFPA1_22185 [Neobacillus sp. GCM10023253]|uniref:hypothetical protein n=1 Tax=Neobacillus sp. GCM10023253 TaxID=3252644 RepID=UPI0036107756